MELAQTLRYLVANDPDHKILVGKLGSNDAAPEAMPFLDLAGQLIGAGFHVHFPRANPSKRNRDVIVTDRKTGVEVCIEVSHLSASEEREKFDQNYRHLAHLFRHFDKQVAANREIVRPDLHSPTPKTPAIHYYMADNDV
ncbi:hypothetical protein [Puia dinghuensis]|uniref:Uncharacterized protein n=1 Tax=Puia dinghuensis TaxID=1792502 RepID=A0A8J2U6E2_9BACT|nr:hypothetical protein [Puia dinghuensis]GGA81765.1 hypothetical protein GCM10011511_00890 [Puia dinghuensis]